MSGISIFLTLLKVVGDVCQPYKWHCYCRALYGDYQTHGKHIRYNYRYKYKYGRLYSDFNIDCTEPVAKPLSTQIHHSKSVEFEPDPNIFVKIYDILAKI